MTDRWDEEARKWIEDEYGEPITSSKALASLARSLADFMTEKFDLALRAERDAALEKAAQWLEASADNFETSKVHDGGVMATDVTASIRMDANIVRSLKSIPTPANTEENG